MSGLWTVLWLAASLLHAAGPLPPGMGDPKRLGWEELGVLGWGEGCSVAIRHLRYPPLGEAIQREPSWARIGSLTLAPDERVFRPRWHLELGGRYVWDAQQGAIAEEQMTRAGYKPGGYREDVRPDPVAHNRGLDESVKTVASLQVGYPVQWPGAPYRLAWIHYSPLGTCALVVFERPGAPPDVYRYELVRIPHESRRQRAQAHLTNALLLYRKENELQGAVEEAGIAAAMDPRLAEARYHYAALLASVGRFDDALKELAEAVKLEPKYSKQAKKAIEFEDVRWQARFREAVEAKAVMMPLKPN